jgi:hypothetical protein
MPGMPSVTAACCSAGLSGRLVCRGDSALRFDSTEIARTPIPEGGLLGIAAQTVHSGAVEKGCIKGHRHAHRRTAVAGIGGTLKEEPRRGNIAGSEKAISASHESSDLVRG